MADEIADRVRRRGYAVLSGLYSEATIERLSASLDALRARHGSPPLTAPDASFIADCVEIAPPGLAFYGLLGFAPELGPDLYRDEALDALRALLGDEMHLELVGAVLSDESRPFTEWESHLGGIDDERWRREGKRPRQREVVRVVHFLLLDALEEDAPWQVIERAVGDPVDPRGDLHEPTWPGATKVVAPAGSVLLLEESVWHSVLPMTRPGRRRFIGSFFAAPEAAPTVGRDGTLDDLPPEAIDARLSSVLAHRPEGEGHSPR